MDLSTISSINPKTSLIESISLSRLIDHQSLLDLARLVLEDHEHKKFDLHKILIKDSCLEESDYHALYDLLSHSHHLSDVHLSGNYIDIDHAVSMLNLLKSAHVKLASFIFTDNWVGDEDSARFIWALDDQENLVNLDLSLDWLGDSGVSHLVEVLMHQPSLQELNLSCNDFHKKGLTDLIDFLNSQEHLTSLDLSYNHLNSASADSIVDLLTHNTILKNLMINSNDIGQTGGQKIATILTKNKGLKTLDISDNNLDEKTVMQMIDQAIQHESLSQLNISHNKISLEGASVIKSRVKGKLEIIV